MNVPTIQAIHDAAKKFGLPLMLKSRLGAYDGRGNAVLKDTSDECISNALESLGMSVEKAKDGQNLDLYAEGWINFHSEIAVMVVRSITGETKSYPAVTAIQTDSICRVVLAPAPNVGADIRRKCEAIASKAVDSLVMPSFSCKILALLGKTRSPVVVANTIRSTSSAVLPAISSARRQAFSAISETVSSSTI